MVKVALNEDASTERHETLWFVLLYGPLADQFGFTLSAMERLLTTSIGRKGD